MWIGTSSSARQSFDRTLELTSTTHAHPMVRRISLAHWGGIAEAISRSRARSPPKLDPAFAHRASPARQTYQPAREYDRACGVSACIELSPSYTLN